jgi:ABC-type lipoprotein export system ATPase subunit
MALLEVRDLRKFYRRGGDEVRALDGVTLTIGAGVLVAIQGRSGSGKSTLLYLCGGLERPTAGTVTIDGIMVTHAPERELPRLRRTCVGFVFQHIHLLPALTALENVLLPLRYARVPAREARGRALELLEAVGMAHRLTHRPTELSGGEQQRVALARALVNHPKLILADEPTGELDSETAATIVGLIVRLNQTMGQTFIVVTHDPALTEVAQRIIHLRDGRIESDATR